MKGFAEVARVGDVGPGEMKLVEAEGEQIVLTNLGGELFAFTNVCPHADCDLAYGILEEDEVECDCHGSRFKVKSGELLQGPATEDLTVYAVRVEGDKVLVGPR